MAKILVIDDEPTMLSYLTRILKMLNHEVVTADNSAAGCEKAADPGLQVIISDLSMPGELSDLALIRRLREIQPDCPIVVVSGYPTAGRLEECQKLGVRDFLTKPFELTFVSAVLKRLLEGGAEKKEPDGTETRE
ncbi:MAG: response regulator [Kiritimatiellia bacterium]|nr:response regulator [Kiritimatiellia bacterium]